MEPRDILSGEVWDVRDPEIILKEEYESRGAEFPFDEVEIIRGIWDEAIVAARMIDEPRLLREFDCHAKAGFMWQLNLLRLCIFLEQHEPTWETDFPELVNGLWHVYRKLGERISEAEESNVYAKILHALEKDGWVWDKHAKIIKAAQTDGAGNRPRLFKNELICLLYDCLRPAFNVGWPECADTKNPQALRDQISLLISPGLPNEETDPSPNGPIYRAIHNHLKK